MKKSINAWNSNFQQLHFFESGSLSLQKIFFYILINTVFISTSTNCNLYLLMYVSFCLIFRSPSTHKMSPWVRKIFLQFMPRLLIMRRTTYTLPEYDDALPPHGYQNDMEMQLVLYYAKKQQHQLIKKIIFRLNMGEPFTSDFKITTREPSFVLQNQEQDDKMKAHSSSELKSHDYSLSLGCQVQLIQICAIIHKTNRDIYRVWYGELE